VRDFGCPVRGLYNLSKINAEPGQKLKKSTSLVDLVRMHCPEDMHIAKGEAVLDKGVRTSNWEAWPLSAEQVEYAAKDAALGVMAFMHRFGNGSDNHHLPKVAMDALVDLEEVNSDSISNTKSASARKSTGSKDDKENSASEGNTSPKESKDNKQNFFQAMRNSIVKAPNIGQKLHPKGSKDALAGVCIIVSGVLDSFERQDMEQYVKDHGGSVSKSVTKKVTHLVTDHGEAGPSKLAKCKELNIPCVSEDVILKMVSESLA